MRKLICFFMLCLFSACEFPSPSNSTTENSSCLLEQRNYPVQIAQLHRESQTYELTLVGTPLCFKNPLKLSSLRLGRLNEEGSHEKAQLDYINDTHSTLYLTPGYSIEIIDQQTGTNGSESATSSSLWVPIVAGAAGAALGSYMTRRSLETPHFVTPPPKGSDSSLLRGLDERQIKDSPPTKVAKSSLNSSFKKIKKNYSLPKPKKRIKKFKRKRRR